MKKRFLIPNSKFLILFVLAIAVFFRFYQLNNVPPSPSLDEVSIGWNAYSLLKTGRDEYGYRLPVLLRAYDDWRPALYVYLVIPFVKLFGLTAAAVRTPAVILSMITVVATYFLVNELFINELKEKSELFNSLTRNKLTALIASFLLALSPWHIYLSRLGHEVGAGLTFSVLGLLAFLKWTRGRQQWLLISAFFWALTLYTYQSQKIFTPATLLLLTVIFRKKLLAKRLTVFLAALFGLVLLLPFFKTTFAPGGLMRAQGASLFANLPETYYQARERLVRDYRQGWVLGRFLDNPKLATSLYILRAYFSHFDPNWLFFSRFEQERHKIPSLGLFYLWELPLIAVGVFELVKNKLSRNTKLLIFGWLLIGPLPAALATQTPHGMRSIGMLPMAQIVAAMGVVALVTKLPKSRWCVAAGLAVIVLFFSLAFLFHNYFFNFPYEQSDSFQYPLSQAIPFVLSIEKNYDAIVFSERGQAEQSYMHFLFHSRTDPAWYLAQGGTIFGGFGQEHQFGKYQFRYIDWNHEAQTPATGKILYTGNILSAIPDIPEGVGDLKTFNLLDGRPAIKVVAR